MCNRPPWHLRTSSPCCWFAVAALLLPPTCSRKVPCVRAPGPAPCSPPCSRPSLPPQVRSTTTPPCSYLGRVLKRLLHVLLNVLLVDQLLNLLLHLHVERVGVGQRVVLLKLLVPRLLGTARNRGVSAIRDELGLGGKGPKSSSSCCWSRVSWSLRQM